MLESNLETLVAEKEKEKFAGEKTPQSSKCSYLKQTLS